MNVIVLTFQLTACSSQKLAQCSLGKSVCQLFTSFRLAIIVFHYDTQTSLFVKLGPNSSFRHTVCFLFMWSSWKFPILWNRASYFSSDLSCSVWFWAGGCFCEGKARCYSSYWDQSVASSEDTTISLQSHMILLQKTALSSKEYLEVLQYSNFEDILNFISVCILQPCRRFYLTVWGMTTMSISSKYLGFWLTFLFLLHRKSPFL